LPIRTPHRPLELFNHFANYRIFTRTAVPKSANSQCVGIAFSDPDTFRACLIMSALHYSRISGSLRECEMEETYLYHKLEAMRLVNSKVADPATCISDGCLSLIAGLALAESGMGDSNAAEAHINGLCTFIDMKHPEEWQHRFYGLLQRIIIMADSYIAASRDPSLESQIIETNDMALCYPHPYFTKPTSALLSTAQVQATNLSPFYLTSSPGLEACKADVEGEVLFSTLRRLTSLCFPPHDNSNNKAISLLLSDAESYRASLFFQPEPPSSSPTPSSNQPRRPDTKKRKRKDHPYQQTPPIYFPSSSRAWVAAGYLYTHLLLSPLWTHTSQDQTIDPDLLWYLLHTLQDDLTKTEEAMKIGAYSSELWIWGVIIGAYAVQFSLRGQQDAQVMGDGSDDSLPGFDNPDQRYREFNQQHGQNQIPAASPPPKDYLHSLRIFFSQKIAVWSDTTKVVEWEGAKQMLGRIVWPQQASAQTMEQSVSLEIIMRRIWAEGVSGCGHVFGDVQP
ncbi:hypothetical protein B0T21DRAFT_296339, partial [Apiosordaria backusii]